MKRLFILLPIMVALLLAACKKDPGTQSISSLNIVNASIDVSAIAVNFSTPPLPFYKTNSYVYNASYIEYGLQGGNNTISMLSADDSTHVLFSGDIDLKPGVMYSLFFAGQPPKYDTLLTTDVVPIYTDSISGIRFVNLSPGGTSISVNLVGNPYIQKEFSSLEYKHLSSFKTYSANMNAGGVYNFEIHDESTGNLLTTYNWYYSLKKNTTVVISGLESNDNVYAFSYNNF